MKDYPRTGELVSLGDALGGDASDEQVASRCSDCGAPITVPRWIWELAVQFHKRLTSRGNQGLKGAGRCARCGEAWEAEQHRLADQRHDNHQIIWRRLREQIGRARRGQVAVAEVDKMLEELPDDFATAYVDALKSYRHKLDEARSREDRAVATNANSLELE